LTPIRPSHTSTLFPYTTLFRSKRMVVKRAIATLPDKYRAPLVLRDVEGKSYDEIAAIMQTSEGTVKSRINRARNFLRDKMRSYVDRKSTRLNSSHRTISYAVFC